MRITQIEIYKSRIKLKEPFVISLGLHSHAENIIVRIKTDSGIAGFGECSPFMTINGESMDTCFVVANYLANVLLNKNPLNIEECSVVMDKIIYGNTSIKSAFDIALYDIASQDAGLPLYKFLGGEKNKTLVTDYTVSFGAAEKMADDAQKIKEKGFQFIKVKLGDDIVDDLERVQAIRNKIGNEMPMRLDANQGWNVEDAIEILNSLAHFNIQFCEEPIPRWSFLELAQVRDESPIKIMADESCFDEHDAANLIDLEACDYINVKLGKSSGIFKALSIIQLAEENEIGIQAGGFLESRLAFTAAAHLALTSDSIIFCDFDTPLMFEEDFVVDGITYGEGGVINVPDKIGLGASVDEKYLSGLEKMVVG